MVIDTKEEASTLWRTKTFVIIIFVLFIAAILFLINTSTVVKTLILGGLSLIFLILYWFQFKMEYTYLYFSNSHKNLLFRFYSLRNLYGKPKTIEISKFTFHKYEIITSFFNKKDMLVLYQKTPKGVAKYPPISLTLLTKNQKTDLKRALFTASNSFPSRKIAEKRI
ncbi:MAG: hypothetical protein LBQ60_00880 [Bacteroidales bacterium]|jgi:hypothetical protein|nr:hypothetical protein [Bacteroidales bacterium]